MIGLCAIAFIMAANFLSIAGSASLAFSLVFVALVWLDDAFFFAASQCKQRASTNTASNIKAGALMVTKIVCLHDKPRGGSA
jgi:hypothetical protein